MPSQALPPLAPVPPAIVRLNLAPQEWDACLQSWLTLGDLYVRLPNDQFATLSNSQDNITPFLRSLYHEAANAATGDTTFASQTAQKVKKACFKLTERSSSESKNARGLLDFAFMGDFCHVHTRSPSLIRFMEELWKRHEKLLTGLLGERKKTMEKVMDHVSVGETDREDLQRLPYIMLASPPIATFFMTGSTFVDALASMHRTSQSADLRDVATATMYFGLQSLVKIEPPNLSLLMDHLYTLKAQADSSPNGRTIIADLVTNTALLAHLKRHANESNSERLLKLLETLETYHSSSIARPRKHRQRSAFKKGKSKVIVGNREMHMHRISLVTQIQDLFPELGAGFVLKLLDEYHDNVEQATAHLLDDSLPAHLRDLDRQEAAPIFNTNEQAEFEHLVPRSTPPPPESYIPERRNVFDNDEFDRLEVDAARLHIGKKTPAPPLETDHQPNKGAILSALAAFDSDDDERDDTYDVDDVGGTVDTTNPDGEPGTSAKSTSHDEHDPALFAAYKSAPQIFGRGLDVRRSQPRQALKAETGMTDEAIEGWAIMLQRDPKRLKRLEAAQAGGFDGQQSEFARSAYRESAGDTENEDSDAPARGDARGRGFRGGGRGPGRGRGRGGSVAGPSGDAGTAAAQRRKEANKSSRANHNRRDQRARKMARGGFAG